MGKFWLYRFSNVYLKNFDARTWWDFLSIWYERDDVLRNNSRLRSERLCNVNEELGARYIIGMFITIALPSRGKRVIKSQSIRGRGVNKKENTWLMNILCDRYNQKSIEAFVQTNRKGVSDLGSKKDWLPTMCRELYLEQFPTTGYAASDG